MAVDEGASFGVAGMTQQDADWFKVFQAATPVQAADLAAAFDMVVAVLRERGYTAATDERADKLRAALARYVTESQQ